MTTTTTKMRGPAQLRLGRRRLVLGLRSRWGHTDAQGRGWDRRGAVLMLIQAGRAPMILRVPYTRKRAREVNDTWQRPETTG